MNRTLLFALAVSATVGGYLLTNPPVDLQPASPGSVQTGNINVSGKVLAGSMSATDSGSTAQAVVGNATNASGANYGGLFKTSSANGTGVRGVANALTGAANGGTFQTSSPNGAGVRGYATAATGTSYGVYGKATGANAFAGFFDGRLQATTLLGDGGGIANLNAGNLSSGTVPDARLSANVPLLSTDNYFAGLNKFQHMVKLRYDDSTGANLFTDSAGSFNVNTFNNQGGLIVGANGITYVGPNVGSSVPADKAQLVVWNGRTDHLGTGLFTHGQPTTGGYIGGKRGLFAESNDTGSVTGAVTIAQGTGSSYGLEAAAIGTGPNYGVYASAANGTVNYAGWFAGTIYATGATSGIKSFLIDHPLDPENKFLEHSSVESDERMDLYRGTVVTDSRGYATLRVPSWFNALNEDIQYQLTVIDTADSESFTLAKVVQELKGDSFRIRTSAGNAKVNWMVSGRRHDPTSEHFPMQVEREKSASERGKYLVPEAFGKDERYAMVRGSKAERESAKPASKR